MQGRSKAEIARSRRRRGNPLRYFAVMHGDRFAVARDKLRRWYFINGLLEPVEESAAFGTHTYTLVPFRLLHELGGELDETSVTDAVVHRSNGTPELREELVVMVESIRGYLGAKLLSCLA